MKQIEGPMLPDDVDRKTLAACKKRFPDTEPYPFPPTFPKAILAKEDHEQSKQGSN